MHEIYFIVVVSLRVEEESGNQTPFTPLQVYLGYVAWVLRVAEHIKDSHVLRLS